MRKHFLIGAAALSLVSGVAFAQGLSSQTTTSTESTIAVPTPPVSSYSSSKTEKTVNPNGVVIDKSESYNQGANGTSASSSTRTVAPDGSQVSATQKEWKSSPTGVETTRKTTTTTTVQ